MKVWGPSGESTPAKFYQAEIFYFRMGLAWIWATTSLHGIPPSGVHSLLNFNFRSFRRLPGSWGTGH